MSEIDNKIKKLKTMRDAYHADLFQQGNFDYGVGYFNGLETALAELEGRIGDVMPIPPPMMITVTNVTNTCNAQSNPLDGMKVGALVHYVIREGVHRPALIVEIWDKAHVNGCCNLVVFVDGMNDVKRHIADPLANESVATLWQTSRLYSEKHEVCTWHWPD